MNRVKLVILYSKEYELNGQLLCRQSDALMKKFSEDMPCLIEAKRMGMYKIESEKGLVPGTDLPKLVSESGIIVANGIDDIWDYLFPPPPYIPQAPVENEPLTVEELLERAAHDGVKERTVARPEKDGHFITEEEVVHKPKIPAIMRRVEEKPSSEEMVDNYVNEILGSEMSDTKHSRELISKSSEEEYDEEIYM